MRSPSYHGLAPAAWDEMVIGDSMPRAPVAPVDGPWLGVLGGMGPAATSDFLRRIAIATPATRDQDHYRTLVYSDPTTPDRSDALLGVGPSPIPKLLAGVRFLSEAGATAIAIPCNSAHAWYEELQLAATAPILHIADAAVRAVICEVPEVRAVGVLGTEGTLKLGLYQQRLARSDLRAIVPSDPASVAVVMQAIRAVKAGHVSAAVSLLRDAARGLEKRGAEVIIIGCTDLSVAASAAVTLGETRFIDAADALAVASIACVEATEPEA